MIDLFKTHSLTFYNPTAGAYDETTLSWGEDTITSVPGVLGSLQPVGEGEIQYVLPQGIRTDSAYHFLTKQALQTASEFTKTLASYTVIKGRKFETFETGDWTGFGGEVAEHYHYILVGKSLNAEGAEG